MNIYIRQNDNDLLKYLNISEFNEIAQLQTYKNLKNGEKLFSNGDTGKDIYFIEEGILEISNFSENSKDTTLSFFEGEIIGEISFAINVPRQFDSTAIGNTKLINVGKTGKIIKVIR